MKQFKIIEAYNSLPEFSDVKGLTKRDQWELYKLKGLLKPHFDFQVEQEENIKSKYRAYADNEGNLTGEKMNQFVKELDEITNMDVDISFEKPQIKITDGMTLKIMAPLEDFIEFLPPEE